MRYFLHDTNSFDDEKITELFLKFGYEGLGLFYTALEKFGKQEKPIKTSVIKAQLKVGKRLEKCWNFMEEIGIISSNNGDSFNEQLLNFSEMYQIKKEKTRKKVSEWRDKQLNKKDVTSYVPVSNLPKVKESKVKESKVNNKYIDDVDLNLLFIDFLEMRKSMKKPATNKAIELLIKSLEKLSENKIDQRLIIEQSIIKNWQGFFPLHKNTDKSEFGLKQKEREYNPNQKF